MIRISVHYMPVLRCIAKISWVRHEDIHVLTVGRITFTNDARFVAHNNPGSNVWVLRIKYPQPRDSGLYECQVSVRPPLARVVQLNVVGNLMISIIQLS